MKEITGNLWDYHHKGWVVITTNGFLRKDGEAVMGRGTALQAAKKFPSLPGQLGTLLRLNGNHVQVIHTKRLFTFPVKHNWFDMADIDLIKRSVYELRVAVEVEKIEKVYMPRPGCGNGGLKWEDVKPLVEVLGDQYTVVEVNP